MKNSILLMLLSALICMQQVSAQDLSGYAPNYNELARQRKTQRKYLQKQIALLQTYHQVLVKGYDICKYGLGSIGNLKDADFSQHKVYFNALKNVKSSIARSKQVQEILTWETVLNKEMKSFVAYAEQQSEFSNEEKKYFDQIASNVHAASNNDLDQLDKLITSGKTSMEDDDRMNRISQVNRSSASRYSFVRSFRDQAMSLAAQRKKEKQELDYSLSIQQNL